MENIDLLPLKADVLILQEYNTKIYNYICQGNTLRQAINEFYTPQIDKLVKGPTFHHASWIVQLLFCPFTLENEDYTYEIMEILPFLKCSASLNTILVQNEIRQQEYLDRLLTTIKDYEIINDPDDTLSVYYDSYKRFYDYITDSETTYSNYCNSQQDEESILPEQKYFITLVDSLIVAKAPLTFVNEIEISDPTLMKNLRSAESHDKKIDLLKDAIDSEYQYTEKPDITNILKLKDASTIHSITNFLDSHNAVRQSMWKYKKNTLAWEDNKYFILLLAFYIAFPLFSDFEEFMNMHGHSLKSSVLELKATRKATTSLIPDRDIRDALEHGVSSRCILEVLKK